MICTNCYYQGKGKANTRGSFVIEIILWLFFIIPGLIYTVWRLTTKAKVCPKCGQNTLIPEDSPRGIELAKKYPVIKDEQVDSSPHTEEFKLKPFLKKWWLLLILIAILVIYINIASKSHTQSSNNEPLTETPTVTSEIKPVFDIPFLVGKNLDGVIAVLGTPKGQDPTAQQIQLGAKEWDKIFIKDNKELLVTYTISNRKIVDFFISTDDPSGVTKDTTHLLKLGNLKQNDPKYKVEFVKAIKNPSVFTGVKIIPQ